MKNRSKILIAILPVLACFALSPQMQAAPEVLPTPLPGYTNPDGCYSNFTTAEGCNALHSLTDGIGNSGVGWFSLFGDSTANFNTGLGAGALALNNADSNTAVGAAALLLNIDGIQSVAVGTYALLDNNADDNSAVGFQALEFNVSSVTNAALGVFAAQNNDSSGNGSADFNTAVGGFALQANVDGTRNTAVGAGAMESANGGSDNTAVGELAGNALGGGSSNICIGSGVGGIAGENNTVRIGDNLPTAAGASQCFIGGIVSHLVPQAPGNPVVTIDPVTQQLGMTTDFSAAKIEEQQKKIEEQQASITQLKIEMQTMVAQLKEQASQIQKVSAQLEMQRPATKVVVNEP